MVRPLDYTNGFYHGLKRGSSAFSQSSQENVFRHASCYESKDKSFSLGKLPSGRLSAPHQQIAPAKGGNFTNATLVRPDRPVIEL
jgi:hypothetical protein